MKETVGFIGVGVMGKSMAQHIMDDGYQVLVYTRTKSKADDLLANGATWKDSVGELASEADIVITMIGYPRDVEDVYFSEDGLLAHMKKGATLIDMTTSKPSLAKKIAAAAKEKAGSALDAPVSGGDVGARNKKLVIMIGGDQEAYERCLPLFETMGENIQYLGEAGNGQHTKMCNQIAVAASMIGAAEAMGYAKEAGLDQEKVLKSISTGAGGSWTLQNLAPRMLNEDFAPGFYVKHFIKDMEIAIEESEQMEEGLPGVELVKSLYDKLLEQGEENSGTQSIYKLWQN
ncbi:NAD(P)-dependent oxidoreductase [Natribacillus halophilus]|uniref:3-hydroxyisobutyrate dehydrogenase n=1 Tax=Natribacillus halophilus TaxID=549003 RepID=A0A1G8PK21_9BACI|nr:NAD(P)-dependent oxidoreductase [Natribacillus halophilus]SDI92190.1 3-hydroxyisobutyrate dehydrogenase [Natribacillus halophilus]